MTTNLKETALKNIELCTRNYSDKCDVLTDRIQALKDGQEALRRKHIRGIIAASRAAKDSRTQLKLQIASHPAIFTRPRTQTFSGIKVGFTKGRGKLNFPENIIELIKKKLPKKADILIQTTDKPIAKALENLDASDLKKIGVTVTDSTDEIVIKSTDSVVEKMVQAILKDEVNDDTQI